MSSIPRAKTELAAVESELIGIQKKRAELVNALAVLTGRPAGTLQIPEQAELPNPPKIPAGVPSDLLLRRPDLYAAERNVAAANAQIGVAKAAFFPSLRLRAGTGTQATQLGDLFDGDAVAWSLGSSLTYPLIGQVRIRADYDAAVARHQTASLDYQQAGLIAMRETEDSLTGLSFLEKQEEAQQKAADAAKQTLKLSKQRYDAGLTNYLEVVEAERTLLQSERLVTSLRAQRLALTTQLIKALGGAW
jgi:multidrug efflux system outer membrane protein